MNLINELLFGKSVKISGLIAFVVVVSFVLGCNCNKNFDLANLAKESNSSPTPGNSKSESNDGIPSNSVVEGLVKETVEQFHDAVSSGDFSELYSYASRDFRETYTLSEVKTAFKSYTDKKSVVLPILEKAQSMSAAFNVPVGTRSEQKLKILMANGEFRTKPYKLRYDFEYVFRDGEWKLLKLVINIP